MPNQAQNFMQEQFSALQKIIDKIIEYAVAYSFQALGAIIVLIAGVLAANWISQRVAAAFHKKKLDPTLTKFMATGLRFSIIGFAVIVALGEISASRSRRSSPRWAAWPSARVSRCRGRCPITAPGSRSSCPGRFMSETRSRSPRSAASCRT
jgi:hypothetical protein